MLCASCNVHSRVRIATHQHCDLTRREGLMVATMIAGLLWLGLYPQPVLNTFEPALQSLQHEAQTSAALLRR